MERVRINKNELQGIIEESHKICMKVMLKIWEKKAVKVGTLEINKKEK
jgi:hypothetical protein